MTEVSSESTVAVGAEVHDARPFWRVLLAVIAPLPWLAQAAYYAGMPAALVAEANRRAGPSFDRIGPVVTVQPKGEPR